MPFLRLRDLRDQQLIEFEKAPVRFGRDPAFEMTVIGRGSEVVSGAHAQIVHREGAWWAEDLGGRNGTFVDGTRVQPGAPHRLEKGQVLSLGSRGVRFEIDAVASDRMDETLVEQPYAGPNDQTTPMDLHRPPELEDLAASAPAAPAIAIALTDLGSNAEFTASGGRIRIGRGRECELRPVDTGDTSVSRVHCEIVLRPNGDVVLRDARSRNGTLLNGERLTVERIIRLGDRIGLGDAGAELRVDRLDVAGAGAASGAGDASVGAAPRPPAAAPPQPPPPRPAPPRPEPAAAKAGEPRRSFGGKGRTLFIRELISDTNLKTAKRVRWIVWSFVVLLVVGLGGLYWWSERRVRGTEAELASQRAELEQARAAADSVRSAAVAEYQRLSTALEDARSGSAPAEVVDSLRAALTAAEARTSALETALRRAQESVAQQLAAGDSLREAARAETERLRAQLARSTSGNVSREMLDSLRAAVDSAEARAAEIAAGLRAVRGTDLATVAQANQGAVGLVTSFAGADIFDGTGFAVTASGYFITNRHVAAPEGPADSIFITLADQQFMMRAEVVAVQAAPGPDLAVLRVRNYSGPHVPGVDWSGDRARQGEPAALIGFPAGVAAALDQTRTVRTSMSAGIFSKVTPDLIQFDGFTVGGASGSPVFNASGEVVSVHYAGLREAAGLAFTVPVRLVLPLLPPDARRALGL